MAKYTLRDAEGHQHELHAYNLDRADQIALIWLNKIYVNAKRRSRTYWISYVIEDEFGNVVSHGRIAIHPKVPDCIPRHRHDWKVTEQHSVGTIRKEVCSRCGCIRHTETWVPAIYTLTAISYSPID